MKYLIGKWEAKENVGFSGNNEVFTIPKGNMIKVIQVNDHNQMVLIEIDNSSCGWFYHTKLNSFKKIDK